MAKREEKVFTTSPKRTYSPLELKEFHDRIQKYKEKKTLKDGSVIEVLNWEELAVSYGAMVKRPGNGKGFYYLAAAHDGNGISRYAQFTNIMDQYDWWLSGNEPKVAYKTSSDQPNLFTPPKKDDIDNDDF